MEAVSSTLILHKKQRSQVNNIAMITFWSAFATYTLNTVLIIYLTMPMLQNGLGMDQKHAYAFIGVTSAMGYLMPILGGLMADTVVGLRRSILFGCVLLAIGFLLVMLGGTHVHNFGTLPFIAAYAMIPVSNSLLMGTASAMVTKVYQGDDGRAKGGMTLYYMSINVGALIATFIAPSLLHSTYGPLSIFALVFLGKSFAALNFAYKYKIYDNITEKLDNNKMVTKQWLKLVGYCAAIYTFTLFAYLNPDISSYVIAVGCIGGLSAFILRTMKLDGAVRTKQLVAIGLILVAVIFFVMYNQMNTTMVLFAQSNSDLTILGLKVQPSSFQMINPLSIILLSMLLPRFYSKYTNFTIPYQFAVGIVLAGLGMLIMWFACEQANQGLVSGNFIGLTYFIVTISELFISALGLSMIGLYCEESMIAFAMGAFYLSVSLSGIITGQLAQYVALPSNHPDPTVSLPLFQEYYLDISIVALVIGVALVFAAKLLHNVMDNKGVALA